MSANRYTPLIGILKTELHSQMWEDCRSGIEGLGTRRNLDCERHEIVVDLMEGFGSQLTGSGRGCLARRNAEISQLRRKFVLVARLGGRSRHDGRRNHSSWTRSRRRRGGKRLDRRLKGNDRL